MATPIIVTTPDELRAILREEVASIGPGALPGDILEMERLQRKALLTPKEVHILYGLNAETLANKRKDGRGPEYIQEIKNGPVFYEHTAIKRYLDACRKKTYA